MADKLVLIPVYNEAQSVETVLAAVRGAVPDAEVLVVDDGSTDGSSEILAGMQELHIVTHPENQGYGRSLIDGFAWAAARGYQRLVTIDCDEQHEAALLPEFFRWSLDWDVVSGSRYLRLDVREGEPPKDRWEINRYITGMVNEATGFGLTDAFCGFKGYRVAALEKLDLTEPGYGFPLQFWIQAKQRGLSVVEIPVPLVYKPNFERRFGGGLDDAEERLAYYLEVMEREVAKCSMCSP